MTLGEEIKGYRELCGLTKKEVVTLGKYAKTEQYYGQVELGQHEGITKESIKEIYTAINIARCEKLNQK